MIPLTFRTSYLSVDRHNEKNRALKAPAEHRGSSRFSLSEPREEAAEARLETTSVGDPKEFTAFGTKYRKEISM